MAFSAESAAGSRPERPPATGQKNLLKKVSLRPGRGLAAAARRRAAGGDAALQWNWPLGPSRLCLTCLVIMMVAMVSFIIVLVPSVRLACRGEQALKAEKPEFQVIDKLKLSSSC